MISNFITHNKIIIMKELINHHLIHKIPLPTSKAINSINYFYNFKYGNKFAVKSIQVQKQVC